ncbi:nucleotidyltransferase domain-containing protein [Desulfobacter postgatei]|jgi:predicted nucleotidyltransferase|uniref:nucleotidyltransferase domain-containing protein n=1 Tax=Desulfobacter postgatei TaxID=2293 RepID=UPI002A36F180|nr:nucleotidyltransferase domain-containing protein [Desulfobacter postgatei]MDX9962619.1 nucleotidyltransferase domain-containing protein [Desulfobacter postgatei]
MAEIPNTILKSVKDYILLLNQNGLMISKAFLFGSYAKGNFSDLSDIDLSLVSSQFEGIRFNDRNRIRKYKFQVNSDIEPMPFREEDFTQEDPFVREILETGFRII